MTGAETATEESLADFVWAFEDGSYPAKEWTHEAHVVMAAAYLTAMGLEEATDRARRLIPAYNVAQGGQNTDTSGYHETLTVFWMRVLAAWIAGMPAGMPRIEKIRAAAEHFGTQRQLHVPYWSFDVVASVEARRGWVAPDLLELP